MTFLQEILLVSISSIVLFLLVRFLSGLMNRNNAKLKSDPISEALVEEIESDYRIDEEKKEARLVALELRIEMLELKLEKQESGILLLKSHLDAMSRQVIEIQQQINHKFANMRSIVSSVLQLFRRKEDSFSVRQEKKRLVWSESKRVTFRKRPEKKSHDLALDLGLMPAKELEADSVSALMGLGERDPDTE